MASTVFPISVLGLFLFIIPCAHIVMAHDDPVKSQVASPLIDAAMLVGRYTWNIFFMFGAVFQYYPQWIELRQGRGDAFSPLICFILLTSNLIRVVYWLGEPFDLVLLFQSIIMILVQFALLQALTAKDTRLVKMKASPKKTLFNSSLSEFWAWTDMHSYNIFCATFVLVLGMAFMTFEHTTWFVPFLGYFGLLIEAMLGVPQVVRNVVHGCKDLSVYLFITWLVGDVAKTFFFIQSDAPLPFLVCGVFQITVSIIILLQIFFSRVAGKQSHDEKKD